MTDNLEQILDAVTEAARPWADTPPAARGDVLVAIADALDAAAGELIPLAMEESHLPEARLTGELKRTTFQLRLYAEILAEGSFLDARIDHADPDWPMGARPDLRRMKVPLGPVLVFAASNFPFAFSVMGGDSVSALASGCPIIVKAHSGHPRLSQRTAEVVADALTASHAPAGLFALIEGQDKGIAALQDPRITAGAFTGSLAGGRALFDIASTRPNPIPFYAEMGSVNPAFVLPGAAGREGLADAFLGSVTLGAGQFCTKPGVLVVPADSDLVTDLRDVDLPGAQPMLNDRIRDGYLDTLKKLSVQEGLTVLTQGVDAYDEVPGPTLLATTADTLLRHPHWYLVECFGPTAVIVTYEDADEMLAVARALDGQLTATVHAEPGDDTAELVRILSDKAGRIVFNGWPTGVSVTHAMQHGGPYPATTASGTTSVGTAAIERFLRPVAYQDLPADLLPDALRDDNPLGIPQRVDGTLQTGR